MICEEKLSLKIASKGFTPRALEASRVMLPPRRVVWWADRRPGYQLVIQIIHAVSHYFWTNLFNSLRKYKESRIELNWFASFEQLKLHKYNFDARTPGFKQVSFIKSLQSNYSLSSRVKKAMKRPKMYYKDNRPIAISIWIVNYKRKIESLSVTGLLLCHLVKKLKYKILLTT